MKVVRCVKELLAREQAVHLSFSSRHTSNVSKTPSLILGQLGPSRPTAQSGPQEQDEEVESSFSIKRYRIATTSSFDKVALLITRNRLPLLVILRESPHSRLTVSKRGVQ